MDVKLDASFESLILGFVSAEKNISTLRWK